MAYLIRRHAHSRILAALQDTRVVVVLGARQVGKSTLTRAIAAEDHPATSITLDDRTLREAATADPTGFLAGYEGDLLVDEVQHVPDLLFAIKESVDLDPRPGRFLLTGSANILTAPKIAEALTGRAEFINLWPFSQSELVGTEANFVDAMLRGRPPMISGAPVGRAAFSEIVARGGYPEARTRDPRRRRSWYRSYLASLVERDLRDLADAQKLEYVPRLLRLLASQAANLFVPANIGAKLGLDQRTVSSYTRLLETLFIVRRTPAWRPGIGSREIQHEKIYVVDSGLMAHLLGADERRIDTDDQVTGRILENFVAMELARLADEVEASLTPYHYRHREDEVDVVLETHAGEIVGIEVKAAATVRPTDYAGLARLRDARSDDFLAGAVFYTGPDTKPLSDRIWAVPICALWMS
ncbi:MAG: ATP-binding protein [Thermoanaerobaculia bacterium]